MLFSYLSFFDKKLYSMKKKNETTKREDAKIRREGRLQEAVPSGTKSTYVVIVKRIVKFIPSATNVRERKKCWD